MTTADPARWRQAKLTFEPQMSDAEALMWNIEKDPWMNPSGAVVTVLDRPVDPEQFRQRMRWAVAEVPRLRERVVPSVGRMAPPRWQTDPEFDFDYHVRHISLPAPGSQRQLLDLAMKFYEDPYDRTRPLWMFVLIDGLEDGRGALFSKMHHTITDGIGAVYLAEFYMEPERNTEAPPDVDLDQIIADAVEAESASQGEDGEDEESQVASQVRTVGDSLGHLVRRQAGFTRRILGEAAMWGADPVRPFEQAQSLIETVQGSLDEMFGRDQDDTGGSPLWKNRSRNRHLEVASVPLDDALNASRRMGGKLNDLLLTVIAEAARSYHERHGADMDLLNASFVISTRSSSGVGGNNFTPTRVQLPTSKMSLKKRFTAIHDMVAEKKEAVSGGSGALANLATVASRLPTSVVAPLARQQSASIDVATSNFPAAPFTVYISGAQLQENYPIGPLAGTACNVTAMSYDGVLWLGIATDPAAISDPAGWRDDIDAAMTAAVSK